MNTCFVRSLANIAQHGDTDIFPFPPETLIFFDRPADAEKVLVEIHANFDDFLDQMPPINEFNLATVGYDGFRNGTQIDPVWNAYFLALVLKIANQIEEARVPRAKKCVFSYRFDWDKEDQVSILQEGRMDSVSGTIGASRRRLFPRAILRYFRFLLEDLPPQIGKRPEARHK